MDVRLEDRAVIAVSGPEARGFLQGLITNDVDRVEGTALRYAALLTPQGKILFDFLIDFRGDAFLLDCQASSREALARRLGLYRLRAKVEIALRDDLAVIWRDDGEAAEPFHPDPRDRDLGYRALMQNAFQNGAKNFELLRLRLGIPEGPDFGQDKVFALDGGLDELGGISFDKGCYVGQELTARMKHRGTARKRLLPITAMRGRVLPSPGTAVVRRTREIGTVLSAYGERGFALVRLDRLAEDETVPLRANDIDVAIQRPRWLSS